MQGLIPASLLAVIIIVLPGPPDPQTGQPAAPADPPAAVQSPTAGVGDLSGWKLSVPVTSDTGSATSVANPGQADTGPWMTKGQDGGLRFWAPVHGATTPNSTHTRTELDSVHNFTAGTGQHSLRASVSVEQVPHARPDIIVGQIHGAQDISSSAFVMLHWDNGTLRVAVKQVLKGPTSTSYPLLTGLPLGARFSYTLSDPGDGTVVISVSGNGKTGQKTVLIPTVFHGQTVRFQAGDYQQAESSGSDGAAASADNSGADAGGQDGGRVTFYSLAESHSEGSSGGGGAGGASPAVSDAPAVPEPGDPPAGVAAPRASVASGGQPPLALVYDNPPFADDDDAKSLASMLQKSRYRFRIQYVGSKSVPLSAELLQRASLFAFPGGEVETETAKKDFAREIPLVQQFVSNGGRYLGVCAGGFVAGKDGFDVFPGEPDSYVGSPNSQAKSDADQTIQINWMGQKRSVDFQDGNYFKIPPGTPGVKVMGTYNNGLAAAAVAIHGRGKAAFSGPHFESATDDTGHNTSALDLDFQLLDVLMN